MTASIVHARSWDSAGAQFFVTLSPSRDEVSLYESVSQVSVSDGRGLQGDCSNE